MNRGERAPEVTGEVTLRVLEERRFPVGTLRLFASGDNLRKGNALNAVQVAELVLGLGRV
jgi:aspartate-semialdehyde dehydrogenase